MRPHSQPSRRALRAGAPLLATAIALAVFLVAGCSTIDTYAPTLRSFGVYKLDVNQGNFLSQDMVDKLRVGQTKQQVRLILGTPLIASVFRDDRWDYTYEFLRQGRVIEHRNFSAYFADDKLARWEGDEMPPSAADLNRQAAALTSGEAKWSDQRPWWEKLLDVFRQ